MIQTTLFPDTFKPQSLAKEAFDSAEEETFLGAALSNDDVANIFEQVADLLAAQGDDYYRIRAYREGARTVRECETSVIELYEAEGLEGLQTLPHIGDRLSQSIQELATTGELPLLERLLIDVSPEDLFTTLPGVGQLLARRIYRSLGITTLEALEQAAYDGTLEQLEGFGAGRVKIVRAALETTLGRASRQRARRWQQTAAPSPAQPSTELLLDIDQQYRYLAKAGQLRMVTPKRFNPESKRWLPVMRMKKNGWLFNALYSNTARAHDLGKTHDWVVIYYEAEGRAYSGQCTVVTETRGDRSGQRVVRGMGAAAA